MEAIEVIHTKFLMATDDIAKSLLLLRPAVAYLTPSTYKQPCDISAAIIFFQSYLYKKIVHFENYRGKQTNNTKDYRPYSKSSLIFSLNERMFYLSFSCVS